MHGIIYILLYHDVFKTFFKKKDADLLKLKNTTPKISYLKTLGAPDWLSW